MSMTGSSPEDPQRVGVPIADLLAGIYGAFGVLAALIDRNRTGRGQVVRTSLLSAVVASHALHGTAWTVASHVGHAQGNHHPSIAPYGLFRCQDGSIQLSCGSESLWRRLCEEFAIDGDVDHLATNARRVAHIQEVIDILESAFADLTTEVLLTRLLSAGIPAGDRQPTRDELLAAAAKTTITRFALAGPDGA
jgi:crotonobetainyl-CoA:carnitine CoA-transferase CaiB-like acyl-CoA transferase